MTQLINDEAVCTTAPATLGQLIVETEEEKMCDGRPKQVIRSLTRGLQSTRKGRFSNKYTVCTVYT